ncbi:asparagine synthase [Sedimentibacter sp. MB31-C6]|uniref:asparagine synthase n=1 Tax=Sedimentibacter sp. MB31-C6 TaxID=3109366 RepID=UPI002DDCF53D|nr:asparagine synthase [Sedimentibacter sp. MB36-C1]WSI04495.1 asparagine synthase [Sedimentibacter sp. MB36-C1]
MHIKEGMIPTVLGTVATATGLALRNSNLPESYRNGIIGFGLANIALGSAEMMSNNIQNRDMMGKITKAINMK